MRFTFPRLRKDGRLPLAVLFIPFLISNALLSYLNEPVVVQILIGTLGILLPLAVGLRNASVKKKPSRKATSPFDPEPQKEISPPAWLWALFILSLGLSHFYRLTSIPYWPIGDEGTFSMTAMDLQKHWSWQLLLGPNQWEPLFTWMFSWFLSVVPPSLTALRLFPDLLSLFAVLCAYWALRSFTPRWAAFLGAWTMALSFWPFTYSRWCVREGLLLPWEFLVLGLAVRLGKGGKNFRLWAVFLALLLGSGFYVFTTWPQVVLVALVMVLVQTREKRLERSQTLFLGFCFLLAVFLAVPMLEARLSQGGFSHIQAVFNPADFPAQAARYFASLFWDGFHSAPWGPSWGGLFNPVLGAFFFLGVIQVARRASGLWSTGFFLAFFFFLAPPALTGSFSPYRITALLPLCVVLIVAGLKGLLEEVATRRVFGVFVLLWVPSLALDLHHYFGPYSQTAGTREYANAYEIMEAQSKKTGPLEVFREFNTDYDDKTLEIACYPFDALHNPYLSATDDSRAALIANVHFAPYLQKHYPGLQWNVLSNGFSGPNAPKPFGLFLIPLSEIPAATLEKWGEADGIYRGLDRAAKNRKAGELWAGPLNAATSLQGISRGDRFLTAVYWEKEGFFKFLDGYFLQATDAYRKAIQEGIPAAHLYYDLGVCLQIQNRGGEAQACLQKAAALAEGKH